MTSKHSSAVSPERTYSQTGSRGEAWKSPTPSARALRLEREQELARLGRRSPRASTGRRARRRARTPPARARRRPPGRGCRPGRRCSGARASATEASGSAAVAHEVAEAPELLGAVLARRRRSRPRRRGGSRGCRWRWRPAWRRIVYSVPMRLRLPIAIVAALVVAEAAVLVMRPRGLHRAPRRRAASLLQRGADREGGGLPLRPAVAVRRPHARSSWPCSCSSSPARRGVCCGRARRQVLAGRGRRGGALRGASRRHAARAGGRPRAREGCRPGDPGLGRLRRRRGQEHGDRRRAGGRGRRAAGVRHAPLRPRLVGAGGRRGGRLRRRHDLR